MMFGSFVIVKVVRKDANHGHFDTPGAELGA